MKAEHSSFMTSMRFLKDDYERLEEHTENFDSSILRAVQTEYAFEEMAEK